VGAGGARAPARSRGAAASGTGSSVPGDKRCQSTGWLRWVQPKLGILQDPDRVTPAGQSQFGTAKQGTAECPAQTAAVFTSTEEPGRTKALSLTPAPSHRHARAELEVHEDQTASEKCQALSSFPAHAVTSIVRAGEIAASLPNFSQAFNNCTASLEKKK